MMLDGAGSETNAARRRFWSDIAALTEAGLTPADFIDPESI